MVEWHIGVARTQPGKLTFECHARDFDAPDANLTMPVTVLLSEDTCKLGEFRTYLRPHPVAQIGARLMQEWEGKVADYCWQYAQCFFANPDLVDLYQEMGRVGEELRIIIQTHKKYMDEVEVAHELLATPLEFLCLPHEPSGLYISRWLEDIFLLKHPIERWIIQFPDEVTSEMSMGDSSQPDSFPRPNRVGFNPAETKLLLVSSWASKATDDDKSGGADPIREEVQQVSEYFGKYFNRRLSTDRSFVSTSGELLESDDWELKTRTQVFRQKLGEADFIYLPNPLKPLLVATLKNLEPGTKLIIHYVGRVEPNGLRVKPRFGAPSDHTLIAGVLDSLLALRTVKVDLLFVSCYFTGELILFGDFLNTMAQSPNVLNLISFRWPIWGRIASEVAKTVYESFEGSTPEQAWTKLPHAVWQARRRICNEYSHQQQFAQKHYYCWAAPVLIRQAVGQPFPVSKKRKRLGEKKRQDTVERYETEVKEHLDNAHRSALEWLDDARDMEQKGFLEFQEQMQRLKEGIPTMSDEEWRQALQKAIESATSLTEARALEREKETVQVLLEWISAAQTVVNAGNAR